MIRNIVFDMGQVLIHWTPDLLIDRHDVSAQDRELIKRELFSSVEWVQLDHGTITEDRALEKIRARLPEHLHPAADALIRAWWVPPFFPMEGMEELIRELKENGYRIFLLSNAGLPLRQYFPRLPGADCFEGFLVSAEEKLLKPQAEIFRTLLGRFQLEAGESVFVDDLPANCEGAIHVGMQAIIFRGDVKLLRKELGRMGVRCKE